MTKDERRQAFERGRDRALKAIEARISAARGNRDELESVQFQNSNPLPSRTPMQRLGIERTSDIARTPFQNAGIEKAVYAAKRHRVTGLAGGMTAHNAMTAMFNNASVRKASADSLAATRANRKRHMARLGFKDSKQVTLEKLANVLEND